MMARERKKTKEERRDEGKEGRRKKDKMEVVERKMDVRLRRKRRE